METIHYLESCTSTNSVAKKHIDSGGTNFIVYTDKQTRGHGRNGKSWWSPEGMGLYASFVTQDVEDSDLLTSWIGNAIVCELRNYTLLDIKQVGINDLFLDSRKLGGILCEVYKECLIIGVGINIYRPTTVRKDLLHSAVWLNEFASESRISTNKIMGICANAVHM